MMAVSTAAIQVTVAVLGFVLLWGGTLIALARKNATRDANVDAKLDKATSDINSVGGRVNYTHEELARHGEALTTLRLEQQASRDDRNTMREKIAGNYASIRALQDELQEERLAVMTMLHNSEKNAAERDAQTREQLARISERLDIERIVSSVVRHSNPNGGVMT